MNKYLFIFIIIYTFLRFCRVEFNNPSVDTSNRFSEPYTERRNCEGCFWKIKDECKKITGSKIELENHCKEFTNGGFVCGYDGSSGFQECSLGNCENGKHGNCSNEKLIELIKFHT